MGTALFRVDGVGQLTQRSFCEAGMSRIGPKPKKVPVPICAVPMCVLQRVSQNFGQRFLGIHGSVEGFHHLDSDSVLRSPSLQTDRTNFFALALDSEESFWS